jgi:hypothetical protein
MLGQKRLHQKEVLAGCGLAQRAFNQSHGRLVRVAFEHVEKAYRERVPLTGFSTSVLGKLEPSLETNGYE